MNKLATKLVDNTEVAIAINPMIPGGEAILLIAQGDDIEIEFDELPSSEREARMILSPAEAYKLGGRLRSQAKRLRRKAMKLSPS